MIANNSTVRQNVRWFHGGPDAVMPIFSPLDSEEDRKAKREAVAKHHPLHSPSPEALEVIDGKLCVKIPAAFLDRQEIQLADGRTFYKVQGDTHLEFPPGSISFGLLGHGFWVVPPHGYIDLPGVPEKAIKSSAPHLLTLAEARARGIANELGEPIIPESKSPKASKDVKEVK